MYHISYLYVQKYVFCIWHRSEHLVHKLASLWRTHAATEDVAPIANAQQEMERIMRHSRPAPELVERWGQCFENLLSDPCACVVSAFVSARFGVAHCSLLCAHAARGTHSSSSPALLRHETVG